MSERLSQDGVIVIDGVTIGRGNVGSYIQDIPSDDDSRCVMNMAWAIGDAFLTIEDLSDFKYLPSMRFRAFSGGPKLPMIAPELAGIPSGFINSEGKTMKKVEHYKDRIRPYDPVKVQVGRSDDRFELKVTDITEDDEEVDNWTKFMDIEVIKDGNVFVTLRNTEFEVEETVLFKSEKNGGKFPIMAKAFSEVARSIAVAFRST